MKVTRTTLVGLALAIFAGTLWLHWPAVGGGFLARMDDDEFLLQAVRLKGLTWHAVQWAFTSTKAFYQPLTRLSHVACYQIWGTNPAGHHAANVVLHAVNTVLVLGFLWTLLGTVASLTTNERLAMALGVTVVFAIHPLQVESVAWMTSRSQLLCSAFGIGCLWAYVAGARRWLVCVLFVVALLCKPMAVSLPWVMLVMDYFPLRRHEQLGWGRLFREKAALIALSVAAAAATMITESRPGGLMAPAGVIHPWTRLFLAAQSLTFYPWKLVWPAWLSPNYPLGLGFSLRPMLAGASALCVVVVTVVSAWRWRQTPALAAGWAAYLILILPVSGLTQTGAQAVADRYAYLTMLPLLLLAGGGTIWLWRHFSAIARLGLTSLFVGELVFFGVRTRAQIAVWHNDETLWRAVLAHYPNSDVANRLLVQALLNQGRIDDALRSAQRAVQMVPSAETYRNLGVALMRANRIQEAVTQFDLALRFDPDLADVHYNLGLAFMRLGRPQAAAAHWEQVLRLEPDAVEARVNLGNVLLGLGNVPEAIEHYQRALQLRPDMAEAHYNLGLAFSQAGRIHEAIKQYTEALRIKPGYVEAHNNLGDALLGLGNVPEAIEHYEQALQFKPDYVEAHYNLGVALEKAGRVNEAIGHYQQALRLKPDFAAAHNRLIRLEAVP
ncbi:MAG TPA: tetratricopeptide repeat protein [Verrucomicrobiae bacterium]|nr:tetratricopeptide repeat protein [Verrucomicrobiae bacterium]